MYRYVHASAHTVFEYTENKGGDEGDDFTSELEKRNCLSLESSVRIHLRHTTLDNVFIIDSFKRFILQMVRSP